MKFKRIIRNTQEYLFVGGGKIGFNLAKDLESDFNVKLVERDKARCKFLSEELERSIVLHGSGSDEELLSSENIDQTDCFLRVNK